ncbi:MAG: hypothetical protein JOY96_09225, partial [Verrucomicrobia bacterium]|nr:hypothetical protein [Verrucomicrobiota bacterium]
MLAIACFVTPRSEAQLGESVMELSARYGEPENRLGLLMGFGQWKLKNGGEVTALLNEGKAVLIDFSGSVDDTIRDDLMKR